MARPPRINYPGAVYHVTARGNDRRAIVTDDADRSRLVRTLADTIEQHAVLCHAWVLMDNHYHLVLETPHANLSDAVRHLNGSYARAFNARHERVGHLFQGRFSGIVIEKETYLLEVCRYVVLNPVRAGLAADPATWRWSSYAATAGLARPEPWLTVDWVLGHFGRVRHQAREAYRRFVAAGAARDERVWARLRSRLYLGSDEFIERMSQTVPEDPEIPLLQRHPLRPEMERMLTRIAQAYGTDVGRLLDRSGRPCEARQVAMYAARRVAGLSLAAVAERFGLSYAAVSRRVAAVAARMESDLQFGERVRPILSFASEILPRSAATSRAGG